MRLNFLPFVAFVIKITRIPEEIFLEAYNYAD